MTSLKLQCPHCQNDDVTMIEQVTSVLYLCHVCSRVFEAPRTEKEERNDDTKRKGQNRSSDS